MTVMSSKGFGPNPNGSALDVPVAGVENMPLAIEDASMAPVSVYTLELLHVTDQEATGATLTNIVNASAVLNALEAQDLGGDGIADNTIRLSSGDSFIPGLFYNASKAAFGSGGIADILIQNELGFQAIALGNHEFDFGTAALAGLIDGSAPGSDLTGGDFAGAAYPYLSSNLDFSTDANLAPLVTAGGQAPQAGVVTSSVVLEEGGALIGVVGATTPTLGTISSPGTVTVNPVWAGSTPTPAELDALAALIQTEVDALLAANPAMNKVIVLAHMQQIGIEFQLATRLSGVDIIVAGGSNTRLFDGDDRIRPGDSDQGAYPREFTGADGNPVLVVNTDGSYKYVGRLVIDFDADGHVVPASYDASISGAYATDDQGVSDLGAAALTDTEVAQIVDAVEGQIVSNESNVFGVAEVYLNGNRAGTFAADDPDGVRTQETNLGDLTADANLAAAKAYDPTVVVSIKNGGGIRSSIGEVIVPPGGSAAVRLPNGEFVDGDGTVVKPAGGISQNDIQSTLGFNNGLSLLTLTRAELVAVLEHGVGALPAVSGRFPQVSGLRFSFDESRPAGDRIVSAAIVDEASGAVLAELVRGGEMVGDPAESFRIVTLNFLAGGGDGYPFTALSAANRVNLYDLDANGTADDTRSGDATFAANGTEQDALAEYLDDGFGAATPYAQADTGPELDGRIQNLGFGGDTVFVPQATGELGPISIAAVFNSGVGEGGSEVVAHQGGLLFVTNGTRGAIDVWDIAGGSTGTPLASYDLSYLPGYAGVQSVAVFGGLIAAAVATTDVATPDGPVARNGYVALIDFASGAVIDRVPVGVLPDSVTFTADGTKILVANEGEFTGESDLDVDPAGSVSIIDVTDLIAPTVTTVTFDALPPTDGVRVPDYADYLTGLEPEYFALTPDGTKAFVSLQEANAFGAIDLTTGTATGLISAGVVDYGVRGFGLDPKDDGAIGIETFDDLAGLRMPDAIAAFEAGGQTYLISANEGDGRGDRTDGPTDVPNPERADEARVKDILAGDVAGVSIDASVDTTGLERLTVSLIDGDTDGDGDIDVLHTFGSRSFTIFGTDGTVVFDSGSQFERILAEIAPERFNNDDGEPIASEKDNRSDAKGPEPEAVAVGEIGGELYAFIGLERDSGVMIYNITSPADAYFVDYIPGFGNALGGAAQDFVGPETISFIAADRSVSGLPQIAVAYEISGDTVVYDLGVLPGEPAATLISEFQPNPPGTDPAVQTFELSGTPGAAFDLWLVSVENDGKKGVVDRAANVTGSFGADGLATVAVDDLENPSFTVILTDSFTGAAAVTDIDADNDGAVDDLSAFGAIQDAIGVADNDDDAAASYADAAQIGGVAFAYTGAEPELMFRDGSRGDWYAVNALDGSDVFDASGAAVDPAQFDADPTATSFGAVNPIRTLPPAAFDLQVTEIWSGQEGTDLTEDWFEITNRGTEAWTAATHGALFYDDESADPAVADAVMGIDSIAAGESVIVVLGKQADADGFAAIWGDDGLPAGTQVGYADGAGLGQGGDAVALFRDAEGDGLGAGDVAFETEAYPDTSGQSGRSWEVAAARFASLAGLADAVATTELGGTGGDEPAVGSPGFVASLPTLISSVQGSVTESALKGQEVTVAAVVVGDFQDGDADDGRNLRGFYLQEEDADADSDAATSEGLFVFEGTGAFLTDVQIGDVVRVTGTVNEYFGETQLNAASVTKVGTAGALPTAASISLPAAATTLSQNGAVQPDLEAFEGMRVEFADTLTITEQFQLDRFNEIKLVAGDRPDQFTQTNAPDAAGFQQHLQDVGARTITYDDGLNLQNRPIGNLDGFGPVYATVSAPRMGDQIEALSGILGYQWAGNGASGATWRVRSAVDGENIVTPVNAREATPPDVDGDAAGDTDVLTVASFNVLNFFTTIDNGSNRTAIGQAPRGADDLTRFGVTPADAEYQRQLDKLVSAITTLDADVLGLIELENDFLAGSPGNAIETLTAEINASLGAMVYDWVDPGMQFAGGDTIANGFIYRVDRVALAGDAVVFDDPAFLDPNGTGLGRNRAAVIQTFEDTETGGAVTIAVNHLKSKGASGLSAGDAANPDSDQGDGAGFWNDTRTDAAQALADFLATDPTGTGETDALIIGDLNAYAMEDPITTLEAAGYTNLVRQFQGPDAYSYVFNGQTGTLDYGMANEGLLAQVTGAAEWHINADEADALDYNLDFGRDAAIFDGLVPFRASDHDPMVIGLALRPEEDDRPVLVAQPGQRVLRGSDADEILRVEGGRSLQVFGEGGNDLFQFATAGNGRIDTVFVRDFEAGLDTFMVEGYDFDDLILRPLGGSTRVTVGPENDSFVFHGVASLTLDDYVSIA